MDCRLYVIHTPYQMMSALNIIASCDVNAKHYLLLAHRSLLQYEDICSRIDNVIVIVEDKLCIAYKSRSSLRFHLEMVMNIVKLKKTIYKLASFDRSYSHIFVPSDDVVCRVVYNRVRSLNPSIHLFLIDDGVGTYDLHTFKETSIVGNIVYGLLLDTNYNNRIEGIYCYKKSLVAPNNFNIVVNEITNSSDVRLLFASAMSGKIDKYTGKKLIFLDQGLSEREDIKTSLSIIQKYFKKDEVLVKLHPRISSSFQYEFTTIRDNTPFEIVASLMDFSGCFIVSHSSGGCITPLLIYGKQNGMAVYLINLQKTTGFDEPASQFFERIKAEMGETSLMLPESFEELEILFQTYYNSLKGAKLIPND